MPPADLRALAVRVERLTGPDREVDAEIAFATGGGTSLLPVLSGSNIVAASLDCPRFTASLDAAASLVPKGWSYEVRCSGTGDRGQALIWNPMRAPGHQEHRVTGCATPALALTAAALRARADMGDAM